MKDVVLRYLLNNSITDIDAISIAAELNIYDAGKLIKNLVSSHPDWVTIITLEEGGDCIMLNGEKRKEIEAFLETGGYDKVEYMKPVSNEDKIQVLVETYLNNTEVSIDLLDTKKYNRKKRIIEMLFAEDFLQESNRSKVHVAYTLTKKGIKAYHTGVLYEPVVTNPINHNTTNTTNNHTYNQNISGLGNTGKIVTTGNKSTVKIEGEGILDKILGFIARLFK